MIQQGLSNALRAGLLAEEDRDDGSNAEAGATMGGEGLMKTNEAAGMMQLGADDRLRSPNS